MHYIVYLEYIIYIFNYALIKLEVKREKNYMIYSNNKKIEPRAFTLTYILNPFNLFILLPQGPEWYRHAPLHHLYALLYTSYRLSTMNMHGFIIEKTRIIRHNFKEEPKFPSFPTTYNI